MLLYLHPGLLLACLLACRLHNSRSAWPVCHLIASQDDRRPCGSRVCLGDEGLHHRMQVRTPLSHAAIAHDATRSSGFSHGAFFSHTCLCAFTLAWWQPLLLLSQICCQLLLPSSAGISVRAPASAMALAHCCGLLAGFGFLVSRMRTADPGGGRHSGQGRGSGGRGQGRGGRHPHAAYVYPPLCLQTMCMHCPLVGRCRPDELAKRLGQAAQLHASRFLARPMQKSSCCLSDW